MSGAGKGDKPRPVKFSQFQKNYDEIKGFGKHNKTNKIEDKRFEGLDKTDKSK